MRYLEELREGDRISGIYLCKQKQSAVTKNGKPYDSIICRIRQESWTGKFGTRIPRGSVILMLWII